MADELLMTRCCGEEEGLETSCLVAYIPGKRDGRPEDKLSDEIPLRYCIDPFIGLGL